jgi:hypothetical protein
MDALLSLGAQQLTQQLAQLHGWLLGSRLPWGRSERRGGGGACPPAEPEKPPAEPEKPAASPPRRAESGKPAASPPRPGAPEGRPPAWAERAWRDVLEGEGGAKAEPWALLEEALAGGALGGGGAAEARRLAGAAARVFRGWQGGEAAPAVAHQGVRGAAGFLRAALRRGALPRAPLVLAAAAAAAALSALPRGGGRCPGEAAWRGAADAVLALADEALPPGAAAEAAAAAAVEGGRAEARGEPAAHLVEWGLEALAARLAAGPDGAGAPACPRALAAAQRAAESVVAALEEEQGGDGGAALVRARVPPKAGGAIRLLRLCARAPERGAFLALACRLEAHLRGAPRYGPRARAAALAEAGALCALLRAPPGRA